MSSTDKKEDEPSIEEILASIRQIISDDDEEAEDKTPAPDPVEDDDVMSALAGDDFDVPEAKPAPKPAPEPMTEPKVAPKPAAPKAEKPAATPEKPKAEDEDIFDLTEVVPAEEEDVDIFDTKALEGVIDFGDDDFDDTPPEVADVEDIEIEEEPEPEIEEEPEPEPEIEEDTQSDDSILTQSAAVAAFDGFAKLASSIQMSRNPGSTLEDVVRDLLKPMLRDWLDDNLPPLIEKLVREELEKLARKSMGK